MRPSTNADDANEHFFLSIRAQDDEEDEPRLQFHHVLEDNLKQDPFRDGFIEKLYDLEW